MAVSEREPGFGGPGVVESRAFRSSRVEGNRGPSGDELSWRLEVSSCDWKAQKLEQVDRIGDETIKASRCESAEGESMPLRKPCLHGGRRAAVTS
jgi:hypothetical protein